MGKILLVLALVSVCQLRIKVNAQFTYANSSCDATAFSYTQGSVYENNINLLFTKLTPKTATVKYYNDTAGVGSNKVYGFYQCRYDVRLRVCNECVQDATQKIITGCPLSGIAAAYYDECTLFYSNLNIFDSPPTTPGLFSWSVADVSNYANFQLTLKNEMDTVIGNASSSSPHLASSQTNFTLFDYLYSYAQCTPDIDTSDCNACLRKALPKMIEYAGNTSKSVTGFYPSCLLMYATTPFLKDMSTPAPPPAIPQGPPPINKSPVMAIAIAAGLGVGLIVLAIVLWLCLCRKKPKQVSRDLPVVDSTTSTGLHDDRSVKTEEKSDERGIGDTEFVQYDFTTLQFATRDFSAETKLGEGGFGSVYKGTLGNGVQLAIKRLSGTGGQGTKEFMTEAHLLAKLQHRNLVKLLGFCSEGDEKLLVYEFMSNSSLDRFLFDERNRNLLDWVLRYKIIMGIARGLQYLHEDSRLTIVHRDLKPANILLDKEMSPKIADFGLAKLFEDAVNSGTTARIVGTQGYMAPEYLMTGDYSNKSDVYSYGIMLLEIVSGQKNRVFRQTPQKEDLSIQVWKLWNERRSFEIIDPVLFNNCPTNDVMRCIQIGLLCVQSNAEERPTMTAVVLMLTGSVDLPLPSAPAMSSNQYNNMPMNYSGRQQSDDQDQYSTKSVTMQTDMDQDLYPRAR